MRVSIQSAGLLAAICFAFAAFVFSGAGSSRTKRWRALRRECLKRVDKRPKRTKEIAAP